MLHWGSSEVRALRWLAVSVFALGCAFILYGCDWCWLVLWLLGISVVSRKIASGASLPADMGMDSHHGRYALVTGASSGVGRVVALRLAELGWSLVLVGRSATRLEALKKEILESDRCKSRQSILLAHIQCVDLQDFDDVVSLSARVSELPIGLLIHAAAELNVSTKRNAAGNERMIAVNALAPQLLTERLLSTLHKTWVSTGHRSRVVFVASCAHLLCRSPQAALNRVYELHRADGANHMTRARGVRASPWWQRVSFVPQFVRDYGLSKWCLLLYHRWLWKAHRSAEIRCEGVDVVACHPGIIATRLYRELLPWQVIRFVIYYPSLIIGKSCAEGAKAVLLAALSSSVPNGAYVLCDGDHGDTSSDNWLASSATDDSVVIEYMAWSRSALKKWV